MQIETLGQILMDIRETLVLCSSSLYVLLISVDVHYISKYVLKPFCLCLSFTGAAGEKDLGEFYEKYSNNTYYCIICMPFLVVITVIN